MGIVCKFLQSADVPEFFKKQLSECKELSIAVAFLKRGGMNIIRNPLTQFLSQGGKCRIVVGTSQYYITDPQTLRELLGLKKTYKTNINVFYSSKKSFHPKLILFKGKKLVSTIIGSSNLTGGGIGGNLEANIFLEQKSNVQSVLNEVFAFFDKEIIRRASPLTQERYQEYLKDYKKHKSYLTAGRKKFKPKLKETKEFGKMGSFPDTNETDEDGFETPAQDLGKEIFWKLSPEEDQYVLEAWEKWKTHKTQNGEGLVGIGWDIVGDPKRKAKIEIERTARKEGKKKPGYVANQIWDFYRQMKGGDYVIAYGKSSILGVARVLYDEAFRSEESLYRKWFKNQRKVKWIKTERKILTRTQRRHLQYPRDTLHRIEDKRTIALLNNYIVGGYGVVS